MINYPAGLDRSESSPAVLALKANSQHDASTQVHSLDCCPSTSKARDSHSVIEASNTDCDRDDQYAYGCGCEERCSLIDIASGRCPSPKSTTSLFPSLVAENLSESEKELVSGHLYSEFCQISRKYASLTSSIRKSLKERKITPAQLADKLMDLNGLIPLHRGTKQPLLEDRLPEITKAVSTDEIFIVLKEYTSFFNHEIIEYIVEELGTEEDKAKLEQYKEDFIEYCKRQVFECPFYSQSKKSSKFVDLVMKVDSDSIIKPYTMKALQVFRTQVAKLLQVTKHTLHLFSIQEGCFQVTFQIPHILKAVIFPLNAEQRKGLRHSGVIKLECDGVPQSLAKPEKVYKLNKEFLYLLPLFMI